MKYVAKILEQWKKEAGAEGVAQFKYNYSTGVLTIFTCYCGYFIGKAGNLIKKHEQIIKDESLLSGFTRIEFQETNYHTIF